MNRELLHLCQSLSWVTGAGESPPQETRLDWAQWLDLAHEHQVGPLLYSRWPESDKVLPGEVREKLGTEYAYSVFAACMRMKEQVRVVTLLEQEMPVLVLKGAALTGVLYREGAERKMGDLDVLCRNKEEVDRAVSILRENGYRPGRSLPGHHHAAPMVHRTRKLSVEVHHNLMTPHLSERFIREFVEKACTLKLRAGQEWATPDKPGMLIHMCLHALNDPIESALLRNLLEVAWLAMTLSQVEAGEFIHRVNRHGLEAWVGRALGLARDYFPSVPVLCPRPASGTFEFWSHRRMGWVKDHLSPWQRFVRHVAIKEFDELPAGQWHRDAGRLVSVIGNTLANPLRERIRQRKSSRAAGPWRRSVIHACPVGEGMLLVDDGPGAVHMLGGAAREAWNVLEKPMSRTAWVKSLVGKGASRGNAEKAVRELVVRGVVVQCSGVAGAS